VLSIGGDTLNGDMAENKPYAGCGSVPEDGTIGVVYGGVRATADSREIVKYSYRVVYSQKSIRLLDMRFDFIELCDPGRARELLEYSIRGIFGTLK